ncbi:Leucine-rich repeat-containing protein 1 [Hondaea fermentalgiana]|uniref:Leucine-rich repeat-containing protein 1 n=1 Tax=Hondaea fermentalgiana TaxID=2315210 RepID=A0A2R5G7T5_9STRA|nr:Leucine-rich repeat-containing protein 1 [Hondaea fermentalgiana]|eukprot:GBG27116.1 Leucine-rich repeat-containing protein 1 [Hondaea fermentalgiana]
MLLRHLVLLVVLFCTSAVTRGATCTCTPFACSNRSIRAYCTNKIGEDEDRNTDVFEPPLSSLTSLTYLTLWSNQLTSLPESISGLAELAELKMTLTLEREQNRHFYGNKLTSLPESISGLSELTSLFLSDNRLTSLPQNISGLSELTSLPYEGTGEFRSCQTPSPTAEESLDSSPTQSLTQSPTHQTQAPTHQKQSPPRFPTAELTATNECHQCDTDESSVGYAAGTYRGSSVWCVCDRLRFCRCLHPLPTTRAAKIEADENAIVAVVARAWIQSPGHDSLSCITGMDELEETINILKSKKMLKVMFNSTFNCISKTNQHLIFMFKTGTNQGALPE